MKKQTINAILTGVMIVLVIAIVILCIKIAVRTPMPEGTEAVQNAVSENVAVAMQQNTISEDIVDESPQNPPVLVVFPITTSNINVRSGPSVDDERVGAAYANTFYEVVEVLECGWTKVVYEGYEAYMSSELLEFQMQTDMGDGTYTYAIPEESDIPYENAVTASVLNRAE